MEREKNFMNSKPEKNATMTQTINWKRVIPVYREWISSFVLVTLASRFPLDDAMSEVNCSSCFFTAAYFFSRFSSNSFPLLFDRVSFFSWSCIAKYAAFYCSGVTRRETENEE